MKVTVRQGESEALTKHPLEVNWTLTDMCNYSCTYCSANPRKIRKKDFSTWNDLRRAVDHVSELKRPWYDLVLGGGEPTVHPYFLSLISYLLEKLGDRLNYIYIISNGSRSALHYAQFARLSEKNRLNVNLSIHAEFAKTDHICRLVRELSNRVWLKLSLMLHPLFFAESRAAHSELTRLRITYPFEMKVILLREPPTFADIDGRYDKRHIHWAKEANDNFRNTANSSGLQTAFRRKYDSQLFWETSENGKLDISYEYNATTAMLDGMLGFRNMYCASATRLLAIEPDGSCRGTRCSVPAKSKRNIYLENPYFEEDFICSVKCNLPNCGCTANLPIPKFVSMREADRFVSMIRKKQSRLFEVSLDRNEPV